MLVRIQPRQPIPFRSVVKQDHICLHPEIGGAAPSRATILPLSVEVFTSVSETGRAGALPAAAANLIHADFNKEQTPDRPVVVDVCTDILAVIWERVFEI